MTDSTMILKGTLAGHSDWVTAIATTEVDSEMIVSASRDKSLIVWTITGDAETYGYPLKSLHGHNHFVQDVCLSSDGEYALSASWDGTLRLWQLSTGTVDKTFVDHTKDVLSCSIAPCSTKILSGSRDKTIKLWNVVGKCIYTLSEDGHTDWVSCVRCSPAEDSDIVVSAGWDKLVKVWNLKTSRLQTDLVGHTGYLNTVTVSPDGSLCASGGKDGIAMLWDLNEGKKLYELVAGDEINTLVFSLNRYWLCAATKKGIKIYDLETKSVVADLELEEEETTSKDALVPFCTSLAWSADGSTLFAGYTDKLIRVWGL